jgi:uncharacterized protein (TIGR03118 family)
MMEETMMRLIGSATSIAFLIAPPVWAAPIQLSDAQLDIVAAGTQFTVTNRVSDQVGVAPVTDPNLVNAWGLSQAPGGPLWVANNGTNTSTLYNASSFAKLALTVAVPGAPTGTTFVGIPNAFNITEGANTRQTIFAFATEGGQIEGWNPTVDSTHAVVAVDESGSGSVFKGLTLGMNGNAPFLYAADFAHGMVSVYDSHFSKVSSFTDPNLPASYSPFNVQSLNGQLYVTFAKREPGATDETAGQGLGFVDVFDTGGHLLRRLVQHGQLNAPWGLAIAPNNFGKFAGALLVGNFGDGHVNAYDPVTGNYIGALRGDDNRVVIDGLWALRTGPNGTITFSAGPADESHGLVGSIGVMTASFGGDEVASFAEMHGH